MLVQVTTLDEGRALQSDRVELKLLGAQHAAGAAGWLQSDRVELKFNRVAQQREARQRFNRTGWN